MGEGGGGRGGGPGGSTELNPDVKSSNFTSDGGDSNTISHFQIRTPRTGERQSYIMSPSLVQAYLKAMGATNSSPR